MALINKIKNTQPHSNGGLNLKKEGNKIINPSQQIQTSKGKKANAKLTFLPGLDFIILDFSNIISLMRIASPLFLFCCCRLISLIHHISQTLISALYTEICANIATNHIY